MTFFFCIYIVCTLSSLKVLFLRAMAVWCNSQIFCSRFCCVGRGADGYFGNRLGKGRCFTAKPQSVRVNPDYYIFIKDARMTCIIERCSCDWAMIFVRVLYCIYPYEHVRNYVYVSL